MSSLQFMINKVQCLDETGSHTEWGKDDIYLAAVTVDGGKVDRVPAFKVGKFNDGTAKAYNPPHCLVKFPGLSEGKFPKQFMVFLVLIEKDSGNDIDKFLQDLADEVNAKVNAMRPQGVVEDAAMALIRDLAIWLMDKYKESRKDDIFRPQMVPIKIDSSESRWDGGMESPQATLQYADYNDLKAVYHISYSWKIELS